MKSYKIPDRKAPRFRRTRFRYNLVNQDLFDQFKKENPKIDMDWKQFKIINQTIAESIIDITETEREGVNLPEQIGRVNLGLYPSKRNQEEQEYRRKVGGYRVFHGFDTFGLQGKIVWSFNMTKYRVKNHRFFTFVGHRTFKQRASLAFRTNPELYVAISKVDKRTESIKKYKQQEYESAGNGPDSQTSDQSS